MLFNTFKFAGDYCGGVTPLPIPNREVKTASANDTACASVWESRSSPALFYIYQKIILKISFYHYLHSQEFNFLELKAKNNCLFIKNIPNYEENII